MSLNVRDQVPGTTILVPIVQFFTCILYWQLNSRHQSGTSSTFPSKSLTKGINNANKSANNYENAIVVDETLWGVDLPEAILNTYIRCFRHEDLTMIT